MCINNLSGLQARIQFQKIKYLCDSIHMMICYIGNVVSLVMKHTNVLYTDFGIIGLDILRISQSMCLYVFK